MVLESTVEKRLLNEIAPCCMLPINSNLLFSICPTTQITGSLNITACANLHLLDMEVMSKVIVQGRTR